MTLPRLICAVLLTTACTPGAKSLGEGDTGDDSGATQDDGQPSSDGASVADDGATSMVGGTDTGAEDDGPTSGVGDSEGGPTTGEPGSTTMPGTDEGSGDTGAGVCDIVVSADELADQSKTPAIDCGDITSADPVDAWQAAHDCAVQAAGAMEAFQLIVDMQGIDSLPRRAFVGQVLRSYQIVQLDQDFGGINPMPTPVDYRYCDELVATPGCTPAVADICLTCMGNLDSDVLCEP